MIFGPLFEELEEEEDEGAELVEKSGADGAEPDDICSDSGSDRRERFACGLLLDSFLAAWKDLKNMKSRCRAAAEG